MLDAPLERDKVGNGFGGDFFDKLFVLPGFKIEEHGDWFSTEDGVWLSSEKIANDRSGVADTYQKWSNNIEDAMITVAPNNGVVERVGGATRYETATSIASWSMSHGSKLGANAPLVATGKRSAGALIGAALAGAGKQKSVIVFADEKNSKGGACFSDALSFLTEESGLLCDSYILGGMDAMTAKVADRIANTIDAEYQVITTS